MQQNTFSFFNSILHAQEKSKRIKIILKLILFDLLFSLVFFIIFTGGTSVNSSIQNIYQNLTNNVLPMLPEMFIWILFEELTARVPISFFINRKLSLQIKLVFVIILSLIFSILHLPHIGFWEIIIIIPPIFVGAITYSFVYILAGANKGKVIFPLIVVYALHLGWDIISFTLVGTP